MFFRKNLIWGVPGTILIQSGSNCHRISRRSLVVFAYIVRKLSPSLLEDWNQYLFQKLFCIMHLHRLMLIYMDSNWFRVDVNYFMLCMLTFIWILICHYLLSCVFMSSAGTCDWRFVFIYRLHFGNISGVIVSILELPGVTLAAHWAPLRYTIVFRITFAAAGSLCERSGRPGKPQVG